MSGVSRLGPALSLRGRSGQVKVLRAVASIELSKGVVVLLAACGILMLLHRDTSEIAQNLLQLLHISPDHRFAQIFLHWVNGLTDKKLWAIAAVAASYAGMRFVEGYGLWRARPWAEWIALISGTVYLPFEIRELIHTANFFNLALLVVNLAVVLYMVYLRWLAHEDDTSDLHSAGTH